MSSSVHPKTACHSLSAQEVLTQWESSIEGLTTAEAKKRLERWGPNQLPRAPKPGLGIIIARQFKSPLIYILFTAAMVSLFIGEWTDAAFIGAVLSINAIIGSYQEWKAEKSNEALEKILKINASVLRDGETLQLDAEELVPGDGVLIESGDKIPADLRLFWGHGLEVDESSLTGESLPVTKDAQWMGPVETPVADRRNMAQAGTTVVRGRAKGVVVATGTRTEIGQVALDVMGSKGGKPPLLLRLEHFTKVVGFAVLISAFLVSLMGIARGYEVTEMFFFAVALAVSAIPEGLPVAVTVALAVATNRMAKRGVIVRQLAAVEGLGSCSYIASDKTGTLTCNEMTVQQVVLPGNRHLRVSGSGFIPEGKLEENGEEITASQDPDLEALLRTGVLCNEADLLWRDGQWVWRGDATEIALLSLAGKGGLSRELEEERFLQVNEIPFESERQYAASFHEDQDQTWVFVKGAPERVLSMCAGKTPGEIKKLLEQAEEMAGQGLRVLAMAGGKVASSIKKESSPNEPSQLNFFGFVGMIDPLRPGVIEAVEACHGAGIYVAMVTGDHPATSMAIARNLGLVQQGDQVLTGSQLEESNDEELKAASKQVRVFSRVTPHDKLRIVETIKLNNHFVAVTGDGVNDAPALKAANIGVAMGKKGTDVARDAADIVISDDNFATIVAGVEEGRAAYDNVRKVIYLLVSTGLAEVIMVALAMAFALPLPLLPVQLLWLNLVTNGIQDVALAAEPALGDELKRRPRPRNEPIFNRLMVERMLVGAAVMGGISFGAFYWMLAQGWSEFSARNAILLLMVLFENLHLGNSRSETRSAFSISPLRSPLLLSGAIIAFSIHVLFMYLPLGQAVLKTEPIDRSLWIFLICLALPLLLVMELHKLSWYLRYRRGKKGLA